jgi:hypothetical protein
MTDKVDGSDKESIENEDFDIYPSNLKQQKVFDQGDMFTCSKCMGVQMFEGYVPLHCLACKNLYCVDCYKITKDSCDCLNKN